MTSQVSTSTPPGRRSAAIGRWLDRGDRLLVWAGGAAAVVVITIIGITLLVSVALRYFRGSSLGFATELPQYLFPWLICGGVIAAAGAHAHLAVDFVVTRLPALPQRIVAVTMWALVTFSLWVLLTAAIRVMDSYTGSVTPILRLPSVGSYVVWPITLGVLTLHSAGRLVAATVGLPPQAGSPAGEAAVTGTAATSEHAAR